MLQRALADLRACCFVVEHPVIAFVAMGAVVLVITGAEALYADMGHFGRPPIRRAWFFVVFPALTLNYLGQASLILRAPRRGREARSSCSLPRWARLPMVVLATAATVIASQAVISGAFSLSRQAVQLGLLPPLTVRQTSEHEGGQIYLPGVNWVLFVGVLVLMLAFRSVRAARHRLRRRRSPARCVIDTVLLLVVARVLLALAAVEAGARRAWRSAGSS